MNVLTLRSQSRLKSGIGSTDYSDANLLTQHNEAYYTLASFIVQINEDFFEEQKTKFNLIANSALYSQPTDCMKIKQVRLAYTTPSTEKDYRVARSYDPSQVRNVSFDEETVPTSNPIVDVTNNYFRVKPTPTAAVTNGGEIYYIARPSALVNTGDTPIVPTEYHDLIAVYGAREMCARFSKFDKYQFFDKIWQEGLQRVERDLAGRNINEVNRMRNPLEDGIPSGPTRELYTSNGFNGY